MYRNSYPIEESSTAFMNCMAAMVIMISHLLVAKFEESICGETEMLQLIA